ncbi:unnamed protein product [Auanema sp. JU1783]|nr:unnamed protein product [Auanema sp. JU1783]
MLNGRLTCGHHSAFRVLVRLWNEKEEKVNNLIGQTHTDNNGTFELHQEFDRDVHNAILTIHHDCDDGVKAGRRKFIFQIPDKYFINTMEDVFHLGTFNLETRIKHAESRVADEETSN